MLNSTKIEKKSCLEFNLSKVESGKKIDRFEKEMVLRMLAPHTVYRLPFTVFRPYREEEI